ncbi:hypothetical protein F5B17DRAFT_19616 [Nemania serpens]|nr:hypothetical protein F5B17DRAFT_19616 [Nemania serpens]
MSTTFTTLPGPLVTLANSYAIYLRDQFTQIPPAATMDDLNARTDKWLRNLAGQLVVPVILLVSSRFTDTWMLEHLGPIIRAQGVKVEYRSGKTLFYAYLVSRARKIVEEREEIEGLTEFINGFKLDE